ncbi:hypothetical protein ACJ41O_009981 [Fusarium nematophilum]
MGQYWKFINIDKRRKVRHVGGFTLDEFILATFAEQIVGLLGTPFRLKFEIPSDKIRASKMKSLGSPLIKLPQEILDMIVRLLLDSHADEDLICLSLTCGYFFRLCARSVQTLLDEDEGGWVGDRLIFVGDYAHGLPDDLGNPEERKAWREIGTENDFPGNPLYVLDKNAVGEGRHATINPIFAEKPFEVWGGVADFARKRLEEEPESLQRFNRLLKFIRHSPGCLKPEQKRGVLRNLTTKEYVRDQAVAESEYAYSLGEVLCMFTTWTNDASGTEGLPLEGEWAGHRFDIAPMEYLADDDEWTDVSSEAISRLKVATGYKKNDGRRLTGEVWGC